MPHDTKLCCRHVLTGCLSALQVDLVDEMYYSVSVIELVVVLLISLTIRMLLFSKPDKRK